MSNQKITKTIIKGMKEVSRVAGINYDDDEMPLLEYQVFLVESDSNIQELDFNLVVSNDIDALNDIVLLPYLNKDGKIVDAIIEREYITEDGTTKVIVVDECIEEIEQFYLYDEIKTQYDQEFNEYYDNFINKYKFNKPIQIQIKNWLDGGMTKQEIIRELRKTNGVIKPRNNISVANIFLSLDDIIDD